jgi:hypothetical protein
MLGNEVLAQLLADLLSRSSLIALMYQSSHSAEHSQKSTWTSSTRWNAATRGCAAKLMTRHLRQRGAQPAPRPARHPPTCPRHLRTAMNPPTRSADPSLPADLRGYQPIRRMPAGPVAPASRCSSS